MLRWKSTWVLAYSELSAILVAAEIAVSRDYRPRIHVTTATGLFTVTHRQQLRTFLQHGHYRRFLAIAFSEIKLG
jgi:hypothetical protein